MTDAKEQRLQYLKTFNPVTMEINLFKELRQLEHEKRREEIEKMTDEKENRLKYLQSLDILRMDDIDFKHLRELEHEKRREERELRNKLLERLSKPIDYGK